MIASKHLIIPLLAALLININTACKQSRIPEDDMVMVLVEVFITDATVATPLITTRFAGRDSIEYYRPIYHNMGYSEKQFLSTLDFYLQNPDLLDKLLDRVVSKLSIMETNLAQRRSREKEGREISRKDNLWTKKRNWVLPRDGKHETLPFKIPVKGLGVYTISANIRLYPVDGSEQPEMNAWFIAKGDDGVEFIHSKEVIPLEKDGNNNRLTLTKILLDNEVTHIEGNIIHHSPSNGKWHKRADISEIVIRYTPFQFARFRNVHYIRTVSALPVGFGEEISEK